MALQQWALPRLSKLLPLGEGELEQIVLHADTLSDQDASAHLTALLGSSPEAFDFVASFNKYRSKLKSETSNLAKDRKDSYNGAPPFKGLQVDKSNVSKQADAIASGVDTMFHPGSGGLDDTKQSIDSKNEQPPGYTPVSSQESGKGVSANFQHNHSNAVIEAANLRARDEQQMQNMLQSVQLRYGIYNPEIEPEHEADYCTCPIHQYKRAKWSRYKVQDMWSKAVIYPGERSYNDSPTGIFTGNPYRFRITSPYGNGFQASWSAQRPVPQYHAQSIHQTIALNNSLNREAQEKIDANEPQVNIWGSNALDSAFSDMAIGDRNRSSEKPSDEKQHSVSPTREDPRPKPRTSRLSSFRKSIGIKSSEERAVAKVEKAAGKRDTLRNEILLEERGRWPDEQWRNIVATYQEKVGMTGKIADLRNHHPIQYLHLLRAGYFEPIPVAWATLASNPLKFSIESSAGWRGITPTWRGYEDTAEERLYWVLNHRDGSAGTRMKPDFISEMNMARARMATAVEPPPEYYAANDTCHVQHKSAGYSKQVMPSPFRAYDRPEVPSDDTMILLDVSGSMDFDPVRPNYDQYLITGYLTSNQPKNKDVAKAIIRRFTDAMSHHDHAFGGYDLVTFSSQADYVGTVNHDNFDTMWRKVKLGGGTRVMTGWQEVKELHFRKHSESATHHPVYGWQAGPATPMLRLLLLLDGEATDMDEFELDLLGLAWAHVTIFLIGVDGCPHHHRHANELQRISDVNHHVSFVDAQGNTPERFVTHELLKRHLGYEISMQEFRQMEELPAYPGA